jgi:hypothetical protein
MLTAAERVELEARGYSSDELALLEADAYRFRDRLVMSLEAVGYTGPDAEARYLADMARLWG